MDLKYSVFLVALCALLDYAQAYCNDENCSYGYCCGTNTCCYSIYLTWWFWLLIVGVFLVKISCITCYIRARRRRANMYYVPAPPTTTSVTLATTATVHAPVQGGYPRGPTFQQQMPPPYPGPKVQEASAPPYTPTIAGPSQPPMPQQGDRVNKDTELLIG